MFSQPHLGKIALRPLALLAPLVLTLIALLAPPSAQEARGEAMVQYFNTSWKELTAKMPELAEAGYESIWLPPPTKGSGGLSVGYDLWDRFDLGGIDQRGTVSTRYGTEADLLELVRTAHRFGIRVYFDNIMNHNAFDIPGFNASTPVDVYPGFLPEDFHLRVTSDGYYRKWDNTRDWNDGWQVMNLGLSDLIDIATEPGQWNHNHGATEGSTWPKYQFVRHPDNPEWYCYKPNGPGQSHAAGDGDYVGFGPGNGITLADIAADPGFYGEYVEDMLHRAARWLVAHTYVDGLRLDAVKHTPDDFFGASGAGADSSDYGYSGQVQTQFNLARGFSDWGNHRDTVFDTEKPRDDAMLFGEHLGQPPGYAGYIDRGMRLVDNDLRSKLNGNLGSPWAGLEGLDQPGWGGFAPEVAVMHAQSHDNDYASRRELQHALYFTRAGLPLVYTDGNFQAETLSQSGGAFPRHANTAFLGQFGDPRLPNLMYIHQHFARGYQLGRWSDADFVAYERIDKRENGSMTDGDGVTMLIALNDDYSGNQSRTFATSFPAGAYLKQYSAGSSYDGFATVDGSGNIFLDIAPGEYQVYSWANPDVAGGWSGFGGKGIAIYEDGAPTGTVTVERRDGPDGDPAYNPYGVEDPDDTDFAYTLVVPRVTDPTNIRFVARADGSAENILFKLDGGVDLNGANHSGGDPRDNPPALSSDAFLGYEQGTFVSRSYAEKFAGVNTALSTWGSAGAESYAKVVGTAGFTIVPGTGTNPTDSDTATFHYHDPDAAVGGIGSPPLQYAETGGNIEVWSKTNGVGPGYEAYVYYTTDGSYPEGAAGEAFGTSSVAELIWQHSEAGDDWWMASFPAPAGGTTLTYKIGIVKTESGGFPASSVFPSNSGAVAKKSSMMTVFEIDGFDATTATVRPHNDYGVTETGLEEGFHIIRARSFLQRPGRASIYNTFTQTFYMDGERPGGEVVFPNEGDTLGGQTYGAVVRTDASVTEVCYTIIDGDSANDDVATGAINGNGVGFEPFVDTNANGTRDIGEAFTDTNGNNIWDASIPQSWATATAVPISPGISSPYEAKEWRFDFRNIPATGTAQILVRLKESSSSSDNALDDTAGHFTTLTRNVNTAGPDLKLFVAYPQADGDTVGPGYTLKALFTDTLGDGKSAAELIAEFVVGIGSTISGTDTGAVVQDPSGFSILWNEAPGFHALAVPLPNLYNGDPNFLHHIEIEHSRGGLTLAAARDVRAEVVNPTFLSITTPPAFDSDGRPWVIGLPDVAAPGPAEKSSAIEVTTDTTTDEVLLTFTYAEGGVATGTTTLVGGAPVTTGSKKIWTFDWEDIPHPRDAVPDPNHPGADLHYTLRADGKVTGAIVATEFRNIHINFGQYVASDPNDLDDDDDGLLDEDELNTVDLPSTNAETWLNGEVHVWNAYGNSNPVTPDSDGDGLHDGLEVGWRGVAVADEVFDDFGLDGTPGTSDPGEGNGVFDWTDSNGDGSHSPGEPSEPFTDANGDSMFRLGTNVAADTNGDGFPNFGPDYDPPFFNTVPDNNGLPNYDFNRGRTEQIHGSVTDPNNPDTDGDGIVDGIEDMDRNGHIAGDGSELAPGDSPYTRGAWPNGSMDIGETWTETDPINPDTDGDGLSDGHGEDINYNGTIDGDTNGDRTYTSGEAWTETDPLSTDTDGDGLLDGWERQVGLNPLDDGTDDLGTAAAGDGNPDNGAAGDPDGDGFTNAVEQSSGTNPLLFDDNTPPPAATIVIGPGDPVTVGNITNYNEFEGWTCEDLVAFDAYEGAGTNNQSGDIFPAGDGFDGSRDIVAFYAHDGGADDRYYFRVDLYDLRAYAEEGGLDIYVVIDTGNPAVGEFALPDDIDIGTEMRWEAMVACYQGGVGRVYVDGNPAVNSTNTNEDLFGANGVDGRDQNTADGFIDSYFNSELDAVEFSISRQALIDAGWNGISPLNFQCFTTKDGTQNSGSGAGDLGGRNDIRDTVYDDWVAEDYWSQQSYISANAKLSTAISGRPDRCKSAKLILLTHGNQAILPASRTHDLINTGYATGYHRLIDAHQAYGVPLALHLTPTLASSIQWASVDPAAAKPWLDGPTFNTRIGDLAADGTAELLGSTFSDHALGYFGPAYNTDNKVLAEDWLTQIYGTAPSAEVFWNPERIADDGVLGTIGAMGYSHTFIDQMRHIWKWFGRDDALSDNGYRINQINGVKCFVINDQASTYRFLTHDGGLNLPLRNLYHAKAVSGTQDQVITLFHNWEDFRDPASADAYDTNLRWANARPWVQVVTPGQIARGEIDIDADGAGDSWFALDRGAPALATVAHDWLDHATQEDYGNWFFGQGGREEALSTKVFDLRPGAPAPNPYGQQGSGDGLVADSAWLSAAAVADPAASLLARGTLHAAAFQTAFHNQVNNDTSKFSTGTYIWPDISYQDLADFSKNAQSQTRFAAVYSHVDAWLAAPAHGTSTATALDVDLDGEDEYLIATAEFLALFEAIGGRLTGAWVRDPVGATAYQTVGNHLAYSNSETELEGDTLQVGGTIEAYRTSGFKDWWAAGPETNAYVNDLYTVTPAAGGWTFTSSDGNVTKTIAPNAAGDALEADYTVGGGITQLYVRFGLSPNLQDLLIGGQASLAELTDDGSVLTLQNNAPGIAVTNTLAYAADGGSGATYVAAASDEAPGLFEHDAVAMRNHAQTQQVEVSGGATFTLALGFGATLTDADGDLLPETWESTHNFDDNDDGTTVFDNGASGNPDGDELTNLQEYLAGTDPRAADPGAYPVLTITPQPDGSKALDFPMLPYRVYSLEYSHDLLNWTQMGDDITVTSPDPAVPNLDDGTTTPTHPAVTPHRHYRYRISTP